jgi:hypothetical protein
MRAWRALKASGAAVLRDGVYLLLNTAACRKALAAVERDILAINGTAVVLPVVDPAGERFIEMFDRNDEYSKLRTEIDECRGQLMAENALSTTKQIRKLRKAYDQLTIIDYFPGKPKQQIGAALQELEATVSNALVASSKSKPKASAGQSWGWSSQRIWACGSMNRRINQAQAKRSPLDACGSPRHDPDSCPL